MDLQLLLVSFIAGALTILAPCIFPLLPILIGTAADGKASRNRAFVVIGSLLVSITVLTLLIHGTSNALNIDEGKLRLVSALIIFAVGAVTLFPIIWEHISAKFNLSTSSNKLLGRAMQKGGVGGDILVGASLGPVFSSCSPTYGIIIASILPQNFATGTLYLLWYVFGLGLMFAAIALMGNKFVKKLAWATDPNGWFKKSIGILFLVIALAILFNLDKSLESWLLGFDFYDNLVNFELNLNN
ncbi:MAG: cytochrome c-type biogenesis protein [Candidatus Saccharimonadales bacterium]|jgi:cytochrome c-type biogenesis protein